MNFLGITLRNNHLEYEISKRPDDVQIWDIMPGKSPYPIERINDTDQQHLCNLLKVSNKSVAHLTTKTSSKEELESLEKAREIIFNLIVEYVDGLKTENLWWNK